MMDLQKKISFFHLSEVLRSGEIPNMLDSAVPFAFVTQVSCVSAQRFEITNLIYSKYITGIRGFVCFVHTNQ